MTLNGIKVETKNLPGGLHAITLPEPRNTEQRTANTNLYTVLRIKCGGAKISTLSESEQEGLSKKNTLVFTDDAYIHLIPWYCQWGR